MTLRVLVFAEDVLGMTLARDLCDRVVMEHGPHWLADNWRVPQLREAFRAWAGVGMADRWESWASLKHQSKVVAPLSGLKGYSLVAYKAAHFIARLKPLPELVVLCLDTQGNPRLRVEMLEGLKQARVADVPFVLAVAHQESEAWVVSGFVPEHNAERESLGELEARHGFDPTQMPHRLTPNRPTDPHDAKQVCRALIPDGPLSSRGERCWLDTPLPHMEERGRQTGLPEYLADVKATVLPLLGAHVSSFPTPASEH